LDPSVNFDEKKGLIGAIQMQNFDWTLSAETWASCSISGGGRERW